MVFEDDGGAKGAIEFLTFFVHPENYRRHSQIAPFHLFRIMKSMRAGS